MGFPYFFVGTFIEAPKSTETSGFRGGFPYFFVGTFIEAATSTVTPALATKISLLFRRDFH